MNPRKEERQPITVKVMEDEDWIDYEILHGRRSPDKPQKFGLLHETWTLLNKIKKEMNLGN